MKSCERCGSTLDFDETFEHAGKILCDDCYLDRSMHPATGDPPAACGPRRSSGAVPHLSGVQFRILDLLKTKGPLEAPEICKRLKISEAQFQNCFAALRRMELARGVKEGGKVRYTVF